MFVFSSVSGASGSSGNRVDVGVAVFDAAVGFGRRPEDAKTSEVEIEKIGRRIDAAQSAVKFEIVAGIRLYKSAGEDYLEDISSQAVCDAAPYVFPMLVVGKRTCCRADRVEIVCRVIAVSDRFFKKIHRACLAIADQFE